MSELDLFIKSLRGVGAEPVIAGTQKDAIALLRGILGKVSHASIVSAGLPEAAKEMVRMAARSKYVVSEELGPDEAALIISGADVGITWAEFGVAETGALVEFAYDDVQRLASSLPINHVAIVSARRIIPNLERAMEEIGRIVSNSSGVKPVVTFISGPSRTADIEGRLLLGVHGPHSLYVMVLEWI